MGICEGHLETIESLIKSTYCKASTSVPRKYRVLSEIVISNVDQKQFLGHIRFFWGPYRCSLPEYQPELGNTLCMLLSIRALEATQPHSRHGMQVQNFSVTSSVMGKRLPVLFTVEGQ